MNFSTTTAHISTLSLHDALPIYKPSLFLLPKHLPIFYCLQLRHPGSLHSHESYLFQAQLRSICSNVTVQLRSEEHMSELQSRENLVCRLLLEKKYKHKRYVFAI